MKIYYGKAVYDQKEINAAINVLISPTKARVIPLLVFIQRLSKKTIVIISCKIIIGVATISKDL